MANLEKKMADFEKSMYSNAPKSMLTPFFLKDKTLKMIEFSIINPKTNTRFNALRNKQCLDYKCLYDLQDVKKRFQNSKYNPDYAFECKMCSNYIRLRDFCSDQILNLKIDEYWQKFNEKEIEFIVVKCYRDGTIEPVLKPKPKKKEEEDSEEEDEEEKGNPVLKLKGKKKKKIKNENSQTREDIDLKEEKTIIPSLEDYLPDETEEYIESLSFRGSFMTIFGTLIKTTEILQLYKDEILSDSLLIFFIKVLERRELVRKIKKRIYFSAFIIDSFERKKNPINELEKEFLPGLEFKITENDFVENMRMIALAAKYQDRWIGYIIYREEGHTFATIVDFLDPDINMENTTEFIDILKEFLRSNGAEFIKIVNFEFFRKGKIGRYVDFGVYLMALFWRLTEKIGGITNMKLSLPKEKDMIKDLIIWLAFKTKEINSKSRK